MKKYMVIETFYPGCLEETYHRFHQSGRMLPDGLLYIDSWLKKDASNGSHRCFQLMETDNPELFNGWIKN